mgnify:FL=1
MIRVNIHAGPINKANRYNMVAWLDIAYERLEPIAHYKTVLFEAGIGATLPVQLEGYPRWSASLWDLTARALALGLSSDPDNPSEAVPEVTEGAPRRFAFAREICAQINHIPAAGLRRRNLGSVEITQVGTTRGTYVARFDEHTMPRQVTKPFEFRPAYLRTPELLLHACLMRLTGTREMPPRPALCVPEPVEKDGLRYVAIHDLVEPARTGFTEWLHRFSEPPVEHDGALIAPEAMYTQFLREAV